MSRCRIIPCNVNGHPTQSWKDTGFTYRKVACNVLTHAVRFSPIYKRPESREEVPF
jgi:hypothetical protein